MDKSKKDLLKNRLYEEKKRINQIKEKLGGKDDSGLFDEYYTELSSYDNHPADLGTETFFMEQDKGFMDQLNNTLDEIEVSISELNSDNYGICKSCGKKIDEERLVLVPYLKTCVDCSKKDIPLDRKRQFRPGEEDSMTPFSRLDNKGIMFDREDSYQGVARYNRIDKDPSFGTGDDIGVYDENNSGTVEEIEKVSQQYYDKTKD